MNVYKFKIELSAWFAKTVLSVVSAIAFGEVIASGATGHVYPIRLRWLADNEILIVTAFVMAVGFMWFCYWKGFRILRADNRYGERR